MLGRHGSAARRGRSSLFRSSSVLVEEAAPHQRIRQASMALPDSLFRIQRRLGAAVVSIDPPWPLRIKGCPGVRGSTIRTQTSFCSGSDQSSSVEVPRSSRSRLGERPPTRRVELHDSLTAPRGPRRLGGEAGWSSFAIVANLLPTIATCRPVPSLRMQLLIDCLPPRCLLSILSRGKVVALERSPAP